MLSYCLTYKKNTENINPKVRLSKIPLLGDVFRFECNSIQ